MENRFKDIKPLTLDSSEVNIWFTSDLHFHHKNIIEYCNRPFKSVEEMDEALISNWNNVVGDNDIVFDLGDFAFAPSRYWKNYIGALKGRHMLILGNHDILRWPGSDIMSMFEIVENQLILKIDGKWVYLNHYPFLCYGGSYNDASGAVYNLFGHVHSGPMSSGRDTDRLKYLFPYQYDVGVDNNNYKPVSWKRIKDIMKEQSLNYVDLVEHDTKHTIPDEIYKGD